MKNENISEYTTVVLIDSLGMRQFDITTFHKEEISLGRMENQIDILIHNKFVSGHHCSIIFKYGQIFLYDGGSTNGTYIKRSDKSYTDIRGMQPVQIKKNMATFRLGNLNDKTEIATLLFCKKESGSWIEYTITKPVITIGRSPECDIVLDHVSISRLHGLLKEENQKFTLFDNNSTNGIIVNGNIMKHSIILEDGDYIQILDFILYFQFKKVYYFKPLRGISIYFENISKLVSKGKVILNNVSATIGENEFVAIIGGSGAGKSTLMTAISGFDQKISGTLEMNGIDVKRNFEVLKSIIGFVPQQDIIYENLKLKDMLYYTAKIKMPVDTTKKEIEERIIKVLGMLDMKEHLNTYIRKLSGGQKKRASIAVELLADPKVFFLDEPTSGLDPGTEKSLMNTLMRLSKTEGKTIVMVTHTTQSIDLCDKIMIMGNGGRLCFCGAPGEACYYFKSKNLVDVYNLVSGHSIEWEREWKQHNNGVDNSEPKQNNKFDITSTHKRVSIWKQFSVLTKRGIHLLKNDIPRLLLLLIQPIAVSFLLFIVAADGTFQNYDDTKSILFALCCAGIWIGLFNSIQEICKERVILRREYMSGLRLGNYMISKLCIQFIISLIQTLVIMVLFQFLVGGAENGIIFKYAFVENSVTLLLTIFSSATMGLVVSSASQNADRAMAMAPFILIIQLLFSGILFKLSGIGNFISKFTISRWSIEGLGSTANLNDMPLKLGDLINHEIEDSFLLTTEHLLKSWGMLLLFCIIFCFIGIVVLRRIGKEDR